MIGYKLRIAYQLEARNNALKDGNLSLTLQTKLSGPKRKIGWLCSKEERLSSDYATKLKKVQKAMMLSVHQNLIVKVYLVMMITISVKI